LRNLGPRTPSWHNFCALLIFCVFRNVPGDGLLLCYDNAGTRRQQAAVIKAALFGDLWMWLKLMWLQSELVRSPVGPVWGLPPNRPQTTLTGPRTTSNCSPMGRYRSPNCTHHAHENTLRFPEIRPAKPIFFAVLVGVGRFPVDVHNNFSKPNRCSGTLNCAIKIPGRKSCFRPGFQPDSDQTTSKSALRLVFGWPEVRF
jgi:hypothetical protein